MAAAIYGHFSIWMFCSPRAATDLGEGRPVNFSQANATLSRTIRWYLFKIEYKLFPKVEYNPLNRYVFSGHCDHFAIICVKFDQYIRR